MKIAIVYKSSNLESMGGRASHPLQRSLTRGHDDHLETLAQVRKAVRSRKLVAHYFRRDRVAGLDERKFELVLSVGGDGTLLTAAARLRRTPALAVNSAPHDSVGYFAAATAHDVGLWLDAILSGSLKPRELTRMAVRVRGRAVLPPVLNDVLVAHPVPAGTTRYVVRAPGAAAGEEQKSSGIWIATPAGSTGALRSAGAGIMPLDAPQLGFVVREPYVSWRQAHYRYVSGHIGRGQSLEVESRMPQCDLYFDGPAQAVRIGFGDKVRFSIDPWPLKLFGLSPAMRALHGTR